jgi:hypothetical protein
MEVSTAPGDSSADGLPGVWSVDSICAAIVLNMSCII